MRLHCWSSRRALITMLCSMVPLTPRTIVNDDDAMSAAIAAGRVARRVAPPWPWVGAAVVRDGVLLSTGATGPYRAGNHAEVNALEAARRAHGADAIVGATVFTTLEPCNHHGNTPPCTEALIDAGVTRVVSAVGDPDPLVAGTGFARLRAADIDVVVGVGAQGVRRQLAPYLHHRSTGSAACLVKTANSIDGYVASADGTSQWITGPLARQDVHALRADAQAIIVGAGTALADRPSLTVRKLPVADVVPLGAPPLRVLLDAHGRVPVDGPLFDTTLAPTLVITTERADAAQLDQWRASGAEIEFVDFASAATGRGVDLHSTLALLGRRGVLQAMVEGGAALHGALLVEDLVDQLTVYVGNTLLGSHGLPALAHDGPSTIAAAKRLSLAGVVQLGDDVRLDYVRSE